MKKILAALLAVVMIVSCMSVALAEQVTAYTGELNENNQRSGVILTDTATTGQVISFYVKVVPGEGLTLDQVMSQMKLYVRGTVSSSNKAFYIVDGEITDNQAYGSKLKDNAVDCGDGWYYVETSAPADDVYFLNLNVEDLSGATLGEGCMYADIRIDGQPVGTVNGKATEAALTATQIEKPAAPVEETPAETEDAPVEETGVVSVAVAAVVAVIGGAVVLKKREF